MSFFLDLASVAVDTAVRAGASQPLDSMGACLSDTVAVVAQLPASSSGSSFWTVLMDWFRELFTQEDWGIYLIGFLAQLLFSARLLLQWLLSEKSRKVQSPGIYWILSIAGAFLLTVYGWFREDFSIILGQFITYYIYMWNLREKKIWQPLPKVLRWVLVLTPVVAMLFCLRKADAFFNSFFRNPDVSIGLLIFGSLGQVIFTLRFVYQIIYSYRCKESVLPVGFWILSLVGASTIMAYGIVRNDPVLILGQSFGWVAYLRNIMLWSRQKRLQAKQDALSGTKAGTKADSGLVAGSPAATVAGPGAGKNC